jgi:hypothetical protein
VLLHAQVVRTVNGIKHKRCGSGAIAVSEVGIGTQRWVSGVKLQPVELHFVS